MNIKQSVLEGKIPEGLRIFDAHAHVGEGEYNSAYLYTLPVSESLRLGKKVGIGAIAASSFKSLVGNVVRGNARMMEFCEMYPKEIYSYIFYAPRYNDEVIAQLDRYRGHSNFIGVKIHPRESKARIESADYDPLYSYCVEHDIPILCHTWETEPENNPVSFDKVLRRFPDLKLLLGHMGGTYRGCMDSIALSHKFRNVYLDINGSIYSEMWLEELVKLSPQEKVVFSTDQTFNDPRIVVGRVLLSELDDSVKNAILCDNFEAMVGRTLL